MCIRDSAWATSGRYRGPAGRLHLLFAAHRHAMQSQLGFGSSAETALMDPSADGGPLSQTNTPGGGTGDSTVIQPAGPPPETGTQSEEAESGGDAGSSGGGMGGDAGSNGGPSASSSPSTATQPTARPWRACLLYTSPSPRDRTRSRMPSSA